MHVISKKALREYWRRHPKYRDAKIFVRWVMSHREYDTWCKRYREGRLGP